jgi:hypothetical protein
MAFLGGGGDGTYERAMYERAKASEQRQAE